MSRYLGRDVPDLEKLYARKLRADFSYPKIVREKKLGTNLGGRFGYFLLGLLLGEAEGGVQGARRRRDRFLLKIPGGGGSRRGRGRGARRVSAANWGFFFGGEG